jgi:hypothetical protein
VGDAFAAEWAWIEQEREVEQESSRVRDSGEGGHVCPMSRRGEEKARLFSGE